MGMLSNIVKVNRNDVTADTLYVGVVQRRSYAAPEVIIRMGKEACIQACTDYLMSIDDLDNKWDEALAYIHAGEELRYKIARYANRTEVTQVYHS